LFNFQLNEWRVAAAHMSDGQVEDMPAGPATCAGLPIGRSLDDFCKDGKISDLLPAEAKLLSHVRKGAECRLGDDAAAKHRHDQLRKSLAIPAIVALAAEVAASSRRLFQVRDPKPRGGNPEDDARIAEDEALARLEIRVERQPHLVRLFLKELHGLAEVYADEPRDLKLGVVADPGRLQPVFATMLKRYENARGHWSHVDPDDPEVKVRAGFLRFLALGGSADAPVHEKGILLKGACIEGELDLVSCEKLLPIALEACLLDKPLHFSGACLQGLRLTGCCLPSLDGVRCKSKNSIFLNDGFVSFGKVSLAGAEVDGELDCRDGTFNGGLDCTRSKLKGTVFFSEKFSAQGEVSLDSAEVVGILDCDNATFRNETSNGLGHAFSCQSASITASLFMRSARVEGRVFFMHIAIGYSLELDRTRIRNAVPQRERPALQCQGAKISGNVFLRDGFSVEGGAGFAGATITGELDCSDGRFVNAIVSQQDEIDDGEEGAALDLSDVTIKEALWLMPSRKAPNKSPRVIGTLKLSAAHVKMLVDHPESWPAQEAGSAGKGRKSVLILDNFTYDRFAHGAPTVAKQRLAWLRLQPAAHLGAEFRPQPFEQLVKVLRETGHEADAREVIIAKLRNRRSARLRKIWRDFIEWPNTKRPLPDFFRLLAGAPFALVWMALEWLVFDVVLGSGYSKARPVALFLIVYLACGFYYQHAAERFVFVPTNPVIYTNDEMRAACATSPSVAASPAPATAATAPGAAAAAPPVDAVIDWSNCKKRPFELNPFRPYVYSLDLMLPVLQLGQKRDWQPVSRPLVFNLWGLARVSLPPSTTLVVTWMQSIGSTILYLVIAAILGGMIKRD
jgi:hypothetical protein